MAQYKVPQDVEADDKLLGPFTFRQFIYLLIATGLVAIAVGLFQLHPLLVIIPLPIILLFLVLSLPLKKDQPMETYLAALVSYYLKPRKKLWTAGQPESTISITAPKVREENRTRDISSEEATRRLSFLANVVDSEGRAISNIDSSPMRDDLAAEANTVADIFEDNGQYRNIDVILEKDETSRHAEVMENMRKAIAANESPFQNMTPGVTPTTPSISRHFNPTDFNPAAAAAPAVSTVPGQMPPMMQPAPSPAAEGPNFNSPVVILPDPESVRREEPKPIEKPVENIEPEDEKQAIIESSANSDSSVSTPAEGTKHVNRKDDDEVFISLH